MPELAPLAQSARTNRGQINPLLFMPIASDLDESRTLAAWAGKNKLDNFLILNDFPTARFFRFSRTKYSTIKISYDAVYLKSTNSIALSRPLNIKIILVFVLLSSGNQ